VSKEKVRAMAGMEAVPQGQSAPSFPYELLWGERCVRSVANLTRQDGVEFLALAEQIPLKISTRDYLLSQANQALSDLRQGAFTGAAILRIST
jgi:propanol-preferring alcohol dehydrogenase